MIFKVSYSRFGIWTILIGTLLAVLDKEDQQDNGAYNRQQGQQIPPTRATCVVESTDGNGNSRNQYEKGENAIEDADSVLFIVGAQHHVQDSCDNADDNDEENEIPIFLPAGTAVELSVLAEGELEPIHFLGFWCAMISR